MKILIPALFMVSRLAFADSVPNRDILCTIYEPQSEITTGGNPEGTLSIHFVGPAESFPRWMHYEILFNYCGRTYRDDWYGDGPPSVSHGFVSYYLEGHAEDQIQMRLPETDASVEHPSTGINGDWFNGLHHPLYCRWQ